MKAKADHAYAKRNFVRAGDLYGQISIRLNYGQISMPLYRESCEGQVRCLIKNPSENQEEAQNLAMQLVITFLIFFSSFLINPLDQLKPNTKPQNDIVISRIFH